MSTVPAAVIVKKGFLSTAAQGLFATLIAAIICGTGIAGYAMNIADRNFRGVLATGRGIFEALPEWQKSLPPALSDALNDRREPAYRTQLSVEARVLPPRKPSRRGDNEISVGNAHVRFGRPDESARALVEVKNNGSETVSLLSLRLELLDEDGAPVREEFVYAATPLQIEDEWRGPLLPGSTRRFSVPLWRTAPGLKATVEVTDVRVWAGAVKRDASAKSAAPDPENEPAREPGGA